MVLRSALLLAAAVIGSHGAVPQLTAISAQGTRDPVTTGPIVIPSADLQVTVKATSDKPLTASKFQIKLPDGTVVAEKKIDAAALAAFASGNDFTIVIPTTFPTDATIAELGPASWTVYASLTNADGTTESTQATYANLASTTFPVKVNAQTTGTQYQTTTDASCTAAGCPGSVIELPKAVGAVTTLTMATATYPATIKGSASPASAVAAGTVTTGGVPATACHTLESLAVTTPALTLGSPLCLTNTQLILTTQTIAGAQQKVIGTGTAKVTVPAGQTITTGAAFTLQALAEVGGTLDAATAVTVIGAGKLSLLAATSTATVTPADGILVDVKSGNAASDSVGLELIGTGSKIQGAGNVWVKSGVARVNSKSFITPTVGIKVGAPVTGGKTTGKAHPQQTAVTPIGGPTASLVVAAYTKGTDTFKCGAPAAGTTFSTVNLLANGAFFVSQSCDDTTAAAVTLPPAGTDATALKVAANVDTLTFNGGKLVFLEVKKGGAILDVSTAITKGGSASASSIEVQLVGENMPSTATKIYLMRYKFAGGACDIGITATILNAPAGRTPMQGCEAADGANFALFVSIPAVNPVTASNTNQTQSQPYKSLNRYTVTMGRECGTVSAATVKNDLTGIVNTNSISDITVVCGSAIVSFICLDAQSAAAADATCRAVLDAANGNLKALWNTQSTSYEPVNKGTASNTGLYALFVLVLIPIFCIFCICVLLRNKRRRADNQYKQDTATFANVASSPQPLNVLQPGSPYATVTKPFEGYELPPYPQPAAYPQQLPPVALNGAAQAPYGY